uniref:Uncharacterized protein n=1 Tax=Trichobilharzia regenti TaxID=157069 RepID=A0AA85J579_TRIRE|nr:unnamed protein product [Trichobilharzia regenti]
MKYIVALLFIYSVSLIKSEDEGGIIGHLLVDNVDYASTSEGRTTEVIANNDRGLGRNKHAEAITTEDTAAVTTHSDISEHRSDETQSPVLPERSNISSVTTEQMTEDTRSDSNGHYSSEDNDDVWRSSEMPVRHTQTERETETKRKTEAQTETETETEKTQSSALPSTHSMSSVTGEVTTRRPTVRRRKRPIYIMQGRVKTYYHNVPDELIPSEMPVHQTQDQRETVNETETERITEKDTETENLTTTETKTEAETETTTTQSSALPSTQSMSSVTGEVTTRRPTGDSIKNEIIVVGTVISIALGIPLIIVGLIKCMSK